MIDMSVRDEDMLQAMDLSRRQIRNIDQVEEDGVLFEQPFDIERRSPVRPFTKQECKNGRIAGLSTVSTVVSRSQGFAQ